MEGRKKGEKEGREEVREGRREGGRQKERENGQQRSLEGGMMFRSYPSLLSSWHRVKLHFPTYVKLGMVMWPSSVIRRWLNWCVSLPSRILPEPMQEYLLPYSFVAQQQTTLPTVQVPSALRGLGRKGLGAMSLANSRWTCRSQKEPLVSISN